MFRKYRTSNQYLIPCSDVRGRPTLTKDETSYRRRLGGRCARCVRERWNNRRRIAILLQTGDSLEFLFSDRSYADYASGFGNLALSFAGRVFELRSRVDPDVFRFRCRCRHRAKYAAPGSHGGPFRRPDEDRFYGVRRVMQRPRGQRWRIRERRKSTTGCRGAEHGHASTGRRRALPHCWSAEADSAASRAFDGSRRITAAQTLTACRTR
jgi:hypothetical protein